MNVLSGIIFISVVLSSVRSYPNYWGGASLNPVHGLYVKPSSDGSKGDLFVAATEDNGVKSQWMVDQPISFLPVPAASQPQATALPVPYPSFAALHDESATQKCSAASNPVPSQPIQYAYALPMPSTENNPVAAYPYAYPVPLTPENQASKCELGATTPQYPYQFPFQLFYPQMMSAYSNAMTILKDAGLSEDTAKSVMAHHTSPMWPSSPYSYPMYVMVNPNSWSQHQDQSTTSTSTSSPSTKEEDATET